ncbi:hypothetical protein CC80DRAFT_591903 [Byssothecium circinans]|uniref:CCHC-type domain-containing protein n=1 Tax=Byssothecium circinans TaxID=147558 RepID=A0A6A5UAG9_9PLEO|nr:hypothetical protein CC80DRAFT_591903 [Byssothecium circinans]
MSSKNNPSSRPTRAPRPKNVTKKPVENTPSDIPKTQTDNAVSPTEKKNVKATHTRKPSLTPSEFAKLKTGKRANLVVGSEGDTFIAVENAYVNLLCHHWGLAKKQLSTGTSNALVIKDGVKPIMQWIYKYMLCGEKDTECHVTLEKLSPADLCKLYYHAKYVEYTALERRIFGLVRAGLREDFPTPATIRNVYEIVPELVKELLPIITDIFLEPLVFDYGPYIGVAEQHAGFGKDLDQLMKKRLAGLKLRGEKYYERIRQIESRRPRQNTESTAAVGNQGVVPSNSQDSRGQKTEALNPVAPETETNPKRRNNKRGARKVKETETAAGKAKDSTSQEKGTVPIPKKTENSNPSRKEKAKARRPVCFACNGIGHLARQCTTDVEDTPAPASTNTEVPKPTETPAATKPKAKQTARPPQVCFNCDTEGHIARNCPAPKVDTPTHAPPPTTSPPTTTNDPPSRPPPTCYNCNQIGHIARACPNPFVPSSSTTGPFHPTTPRPAGTGNPRNKYRRRAQSDRYDDFVRDERARELQSAGDGDGIEVVGNNHGIRTCEREARRGEWTRTGLRI